MFKRTIHKLIFLVGGLFIWFRLGIPFQDAMNSAIESERIVWEEKL